MNLKLVKCKYELSVTFEIEIKGMKHFSIYSLLIPIEQ